MKDFFQGWGAVKFFFWLRLLVFFFSRLRLRLLVFFHSSPALAPNFFQGLGAGKFFFGSGSGYSFFSVGSGSSSSFFQLSLAPNSFISRLRLRLWAAKNDRLPSSVFFISLFFRVTIISDQNQWWHRRHQWLTRTQLSYGPDLYRLQGRLHKKKCHVQTTHIQPYH